jgi:membrane protease YdiL (CAAX protease family)
VRSSINWICVVAAGGFALVGGCVTPAVQMPPVDPARYQHAADPDPGVRAKAATELTGDPDPHAGDMLLVLEQRDRDPGVRAAAAAAIAERHDPTLDQSLEQSAFRDPDPGVRAAAAAAHERLWPWSKQPRTAAGLSLLCPGCGQMYLHEGGEGAAMLATTALLIGGGAIALHDAGTVTLDGASSSRAAPIGLDLVEAGQNMWFYSIFDAYRDARVLRGDAGYKFAITRERLPDLASAPFRPSVLKSPWVWAGVPIALLAGIGVSALASSGDFTGNPSIFDVPRVNFFGHLFSRGAGFGLGEGYYATLFGPVGVGEESLFRGLIQTELEERFGTAGGIAIASAIFGTVHLVNFGSDPKQALYAVPTIAVLGSSLGLAYAHTGHKLSTSVAMHFWYDFLLSTVAFAADPNHQPFVVNYGATL